jgi:hypothetical protein
MSDAKLNSNTTRTKNRAVSSDWHFFHSIIVLVILLFGPCISLLNFLVNIELEIRTE